MAHQQYPISKAAIGIVGNLNVDYRTSPIAAGAAILSDGETAVGIIEETLGGGAANTFPGADLPFGMIQWSPDTYPSTVNFASGYSYPDSQIRGFSLTHLSGAGCSTYQDVPFMPYVGAIATSPATNPFRGGTERSLCSSHSQGKVAIKTQN